jgi:hypothetical protein
MTTHAQFIMSLCITKHIFPFDYAMKMIENGEIQDATTIIGIKMAYPIWQSRKGFEYSL